MISRRLTRGLWFYLCAKLPVIIGGWLGVVTLFKRKNPKDKRLGDRWRVENRCGHRVA